MDKELNTLRRYAERIGMGYLIFRSGTNPARFKFNKVDGICYTSLPFDKAMIFIKGYEMAVIDKVALQATGKRR